MTNRFGIRTIVLIAVLSMVAACGDASTTETSALDTSPSTTEAEGSDQTSDPTTTAEDADDEAASSGGSVRVAMAAIPQVLDPNSYISPPGSFPRFLFHRALTQLKEQDGRFGPQPDIATSWENVDDVTWRFDLEEGLEFPDGQPLDAEAIVETFEFVLNPDNNEGWASQINTIASVTADGPATVLIGTTAADPLLPSRVSGIGIVASSELDAITRDELNAEAVVSVGPWIPVEFIPQERLVLERNPNSQIGTPAIDRLELIEIPEPGARIAALRAGEVDVVHKVPTDLAGTLDGDGSRLVWTIESGTYTPTFVDVLEAPFDDVRVRQAFNYAIDKEALVSLLSGYGAVADGQLANPGYSGYCEDIEAYSYDPDQARALLEEAGYGDGLSAGITVSSGFFTDDRSLGEAVAAMLEDVGVTVELDIREPGRFLDAFYDREQRLDLFPWRGTLNPAFDVSLPMAYYETGHNIAISNFSSEEFDVAFSAARSELDPDRRQELLCEAAGILHEQAPMILGIHLPDIYAVADRVIDFRVAPNQVPDFVGIMAEPNQ